MRPFVTFCLLFGSFYLPVYSQSYLTQFEKFTVVADSIFLDNYYKLDTARYRELIAVTRGYYYELKNRDNGLNTVDHKKYNPFMANAYYNLSCTYGLTNNKNQALNCLDSAIHFGYTDYMHLMEDPDIAIIRSMPEFTKLVEPLRAVGDYLYILKGAAAYNNGDNRSLPVFTYQSADFPELQKLRKQYNLDSIAGSGNDISQVLNLMHWLHDKIPHANGEYPKEVNASSMLQLCESEGRGLNCRQLATILNECFLSMGFYSKYVQCSPKDSLGIDFDCHVINSVWIPSLSKWIWIDPTFDAYIMDETGQLLGIEEVRERIINGKMLILNPDANWNNKQTQTKEYYLYNYMAKNLYKLECPVESRYDLETMVIGKEITYVRLLPTAYFKQQQDIEENEWGNSTTAITYNTNNAKLFWAPPVH